jgi:hypothetical protein
MTAHRDEPDEGEREMREFVASLGHDLDALRARHADDPPIDLLRAARAGTLPPGLQERVSRHLESSAWSRALLEGADDEAPVPALSKNDEDRLWRRIQTSAAPAPVPRISGGRSNRRWWVPSLAAAALAGVVIWTVSRDDVSTPAVPETPVAVAEPPSKPALVLALDKPDVRLGPGALTFRGAEVTPFVEAVEPAFEAYRQGDYVTAERLFAGLAERYPAAGEIRFYQGVSRLFVDDPRGALSAFQEAARTADDTFADDIAWYRAVAEERAGNRTDAAALLQQLCQGTGPRRAAACDALPAFQ